MTSGHPEWETSFVCCSRCTQWTLYEPRISWHDDLNLYFKLPSFGLGAGIVRKVRYTVFRREILTLAICTSTYMHQKNRRIFLTSWTWCMMHGQICPIESVTQSPTHSRIHIKDVGWFNLSILNSLPNLIPRPFKNLQMSDINATRLPLHCPSGGCPYLGENGNQIITRGERLAQHPSDDVLPIVLMCCVLAFVERWIPDLPLVRSYDTKVPPSLINVQSNCTEPSRQVVDLSRYKLLKISGLDR